MAQSAEEAAASLEAARKALAEAEAADEAAKAEALANRTPDQAAADLFTKIVARLGNRPDMLADLKVMLGAGKKAVS